MLRLTSVTAGYGLITVLRQVSLEVHAGEIVVLLGANGAGKTTLLRTISALLRPIAGSVELEGRRIDGWSAEAVVGLGLIHVPEGRQIFPELTVAENLRLGAYRRRDRAKVKNDLEWVLTLFPVLRQRYNRLGGTLFGGEQQMLAIARALMAAPRLLLLDEPSMGLAPALAERIAPRSRHFNRMAWPSWWLNRNASTWNGWPAEYTPLNAAKLCRRIKIRYEGLQAIY